MLAASVMTLSFLGSQVSQESRRHIICDQGLEHSRIVPARFARSSRLGDARDHWFLRAITKSPRARIYSNYLRARCTTPLQALRQLANRLLGGCHVCLERGTL